MRRWFTEDTALYEGDCRDVLPWWPAGSFDAVVTDPPYGLAEIKTKTVVQALEAWLGGDRWHVPDGKGFMSARWDRFVPPPGVWDECYRVLKPGSWLMAFAAPRTADLMGLSIRLAGFEVQDTIEWVFGSGFPKAKSRLKPAQEPVILAWKPGRTSPPFPGLDGCRVGTTDNLNGGAYAQNGKERYDGAENWRFKRDGGAGEYEQPAGRWPPNLLLTHHPDCEPAGTVRVRSGNSLQGSPRVGKIYGDAVNQDGPSPHYADADGMETAESTAGCVPGCPVAEMDAQSGITKSTGGSGAKSGKVGMHVYQGGYAHDKVGQNAGGLGDTGGASRFFPAFRYQAKAPKSERPSITLPDGRVIRHSTVKPMGLMRWLVRLVCPPGGTVLDPFAGTGPTLHAAQMEGMRAVGTDSWDEACMLACQRLGLDYAAGDREPAA